MKREILNMFSLKFRDSHKILLIPVNPTLYADYAEGCRLQPRAAEFSLSWEFVGAMNTKTESMAIHLCIRRL
jgi:hypothetical protein